MRKIYLLVISLIMGGCIKNDIPFPIIKGEVKSIVFQGQSDVKIDPSTRTINLVLNNSVDLRAIKIEAFTITDDARSSLSVGDVIDFSNGEGQYAVSHKPYTFTVSTYQDYEWKIVCTQPLDLRVAIQGAIGQANIDPTNRIAIIKVPMEQDLFSIVVKDYCLGPSVATYSPDLYTITNFNRIVPVDVSFFGITQTWSIDVQRTSENVITGEVNPWAMFAQVTGSVLAGSELAPGFDYKRKTDNIWTYIQAQSIGGKMSATLPDLTPNTEYEFRARLGEEVATEKSFRTQTTPLIANMDFEQWTLSGKTWYPYSAATDDQGAVWSTGNMGVTSPLAGGKDSNTTPSSDARQGTKAALITTIKVPVVELAAGSLFTGKFVLTIAKPLDSPKFSRPYTGRPTGLSFWYKYDPKVIDVVRNGAPTTAGSTDKCNIYIYLGDWDGELLSSELKKEDTRGVIAFGEFSTDQAISTYTKHTIDIKYYDTTRDVKKIIIVASSSIYGDFYTGGIGSTLFFDDLQFLWTAPVEP